MPWFLALLLILSTYPIFLHADYPVTVDDPRIKFSPRMYGRTTVVVNDTMYVYGGRTSLGAIYTNNMYRYNFNQDTGIVNMSMVDQKNAGPNCSFCGAVMMDETRMLILTHDFANATEEDSENIMQVVRPFVFDFETLTWSSNSTTPRYNASMNSTFTMRAKHSTVLGGDGLIYTIGGVSFFNESIRDNPSWYYDMKNDYYGIIQPNSDSIDIFPIGGNAFNLANGNIGSVLGGRGSDIEGYYGSQYMFVLNTYNKSWEIPTNITNYNDDNVIACEGSTMQLSANNTIAYIFGGIKTGSNSSDYIYSRLRVLNIRNFTWLSTAERNDNYHVQPRSYASSAIIGNKYFIVAFGNSLRKRSDLKDVNIFALPSIMPNGIDLAPENNKEVIIHLLSSILNNVNSISLHRVSTSIVLFIIFIVLTATVFGFIIAFVVNRKRIKDTNIHLLQAISKNIWNRRAGELLSTQLYGFIAKSVLVLILLSFILYFMHSIINSSVSFTEESIDVTTITFPGWAYLSINDVYGQDFPQLFCSHINAPDDVACGNTTILDRTLFSPSFVEQAGDTQCHLYDSISNVTVVSQDRAVLRFYHMGFAYHLQQAVHLQFYEPHKNPNRVLFRNETIPGYDVKFMDDWLASESNSGSKSDDLSRVVSVHPDSTMYIQFETVYTHQIDPDSWWNFVGIFPKYIYTSELSITHTEPMSRGTYAKTEGQEAVVLGDIVISPKTFSQRIITEKRDTTIVSSLGVVGGIVGILLAIQVFLFGARPPKPWGIVHTTTIRSSIKDKRQRILEKYFSVPDAQSVPFVTPVHQRFSSIYELNSSDNHHDHEEQLIEENVLLDDEGLKLDHDVDETLSKTPILDAAMDIKDTLKDLQERLGHLEGRNQMLELVLKAYYIDDRIFQELHKPSSSEPSRKDGQLCKKLQQILLIIRSFHRLEKENSTGPFHCCKAANLQSCKAAKLQSCKAGTKAAKLQSWNKSCRSAKLQSWNKSCKAAKLQSCNFDGICIVMSQLG
ncbi:uncharacterized protein EV154DRAFT_576901 [Mucor mucedo]|uniref:uncharacterized protein n=1 Tax=Mucor mucedo TaxID=29922 RepID=UPI0022201980|nr:uncharacterized protein EV154DRAFT_576901 [Mucor mucedo]KAI7877303.1 hypothetical protein EV154DRAFT_576901 [Mucor mucedo]